MAFLIRNPFYRVPSASRSGRRDFIRLAQALLLFIVLGLMHLDPPVAQAEVSREYQLKAVFLFNFAQFTEWPTNAFSKPDEPIVIGVLGNNPFGEVLQDTVRGENINGRKLVVETYRRMEEIQACHILFIAPPENRRSERIAERLKGKPVLTVTDTPTAAGSGVMIWFVEENNKLRIRINLDSVRSSQLTISSKLLRAAEVGSAGGPRS